MITVVSLIIYHDYPAPGPPPARGSGGSPRPRARPALNYTIIYYTMIS